MTAHKNRVQSLVNDEDTIDNSDAKSEQLKGNCANNGQQDANAQA